MTEIIYPPCKYCGKSHGMGIEDMATGKIEPIDICKDCLFGDWTKSRHLDELTRQSEEKGLYEMKDNMTVKDEISL
jgi:hypothetical protein